VDAERDLAFVPTGSASPDYFGGIRRGDNKWANSVVALKASSGELVWGFQVVHHDLWDYDVASQPTLFTWKDQTPAIAITTKMGRVFVLDRRNGKPLFPVTEQTVPKSDIPGETAWPTQPSGISTVPEGLKEGDGFGFTPEDQKWCDERIAASRSEGIFTPPSVQGTIVYPGNAGGVNWSSSAFDPQRHLLIMNTNHLAMWVKLIERTRSHGVWRAEENRMEGEFARQSGAPYAMYREPFLSPKGTPCTAPPFGTTLALDLFTGEEGLGRAAGNLQRQNADGHDKFRRGDCDGGRAWCSRRRRWMDFCGRLMRIRGGRSGSMSCPRAGRLRR
jgi:quinoprotein glucose dehydrogenase